MVSRLGSPCFVFWGLSSDDRAHRSSQKPVDMAPSASGVPTAQDPPPFHRAEVNAMNKTPHPGCLDEGWSQPDCIFCTEYEWLHHYRELPCYKLDSLLSSHSLLLLRPSALEKSGHLYIKIDDNCKSINEHGDASGLLVQCRPGRGRAGNPPWPTEPSSACNLFPGSRGPAK